MLSRDHRIACQITRHSCDIIVPQLFGQTRRNAGLFDGKAGHIGRIIAPTIAIQMNPGAPDMTERTTR
jgi:hypothetical protein